MTRRTALIAVLVLVLSPVPALPQALTSLSSVRVGYNTRKNTVKPQGELKAQIDALDAQIAEATRLGRNGELRRLYREGHRAARRPPVDRRARLRRVARAAHRARRRRFVEAVPGAARADLQRRRLRCERALTRARRRCASGPAPAHRHDAAAARRGREGPRHVRRRRRAICASRRFRFELDVRDVADGTVRAGRRGDCDGERALGAAHA